MAKFGAGEYVRNIIYNVISVFLLAVTFIACTLFLSNVNAQLRYTKFIRPYLDENSIVIGRLGANFDVTELKGYEKSIMTKEVYCESSDISCLENCLVYDDYAMEKFAPRLVSGEQISKNDSNLDEIQVLVSNNASGVTTGDLIEISFYGEKDTITVKARVKGVIASGQKLLFGKRVSINKNMRVGDIFGTYNYEQQQYSIIITTEDELKKINENVFFDNYRCIVKFDDSISEEDSKENYQKVLEYERVNGSTGTDTFPETNVLVKDMEMELRDIMIENIPYCAAVLVLVIVCIVCMVSIKVSNSMRYYATLYICGMPYLNSVCISGVEMLINNVLAVILTVSFVGIQNKLLLFGEVNCNFGLLQIGVIVIIAIVVIVGTMFITGKTLKERSPMSVLRDTAY